MSYQAVDWAMEQDVDSTSEYAVLVFLAHCLNPKTGQCTPSLATIAKRTRQSTRNAQRAIKALEVAGLISKTLIFQDGKSALAGTSYTLKMGGLSTQGGIDTVSTRVDTMSIGCRHDVVGVWTPCRDGIDTMSTKQVTEQAIEHTKEQVIREQAFEDTPPPSDENVEVQTEKRTGKKRSIDPQVVLNLFVKTLPELPKLRGGLTESRKTAIEARAKDAMAEDGVTADELEGWFRDFFESVRRSSFLMGRKTEFIARFDWLMKKANAEKVLSGNYEDRKPTRGGGKNLPDTSTIDYEDGLYE